MNQVLKDYVYNMGATKQIAFIERISGMNEEEVIMLELLHRRYSDVAIEQEMSIDRKTRQRIEDSVRAKLRCGIFECINYYMSVYDE